MPKQPYSIYLFFLVLTLNACGGGDDASSVPPTAVVAPQVQTKVMNFTVMGEYVDGTVVCVDRDQSGSCDPTEAQGITGADGKIALNVSLSEVGKFPIVAQVPGSTIKSNNPASTGSASYTLSAPADQPFIVSPLSTLVQYLVSTGKKTVPATTQISNAVGDPTIDYLKSKNASAPQVRMAATIVAALMQDPAKLAPLGSKQPQGAVARMDALITLLPKIKDMAKTLSAPGAACATEPNTSLCQGALTTALLGMTQSPAQSVAQGVGQNAGQNTTSNNPPTQASDGVMQTATISSVRNQNGNIDNGGRSSTLSLTLDGAFSAALGNDYRVHVFDAANDLGLANTDEAMKTWTFALTELHPGAHSFRATVVRESDNRQGTASSAYTVSLGNDISLSGSTNVLDTIVLSVRNLWANVVSVVWDFGSQAGALVDGITQRTTMVVNAVMDSVRLAYTAASSYVVTAIFKNTDGSEVDRARLAVTVGVGTVGAVASIDSVWDGDRTVARGAEVITSQPQIRGTLSEGLGNSGFYDVLVYDGNTLLEGRASVDGLNWTFTPPSGLGDGVHSLTAVVSRIDRTLGAPSAPWTLSVSSSAPTVIPKNGFLPSLEFNTYAASDSLSDTTGDLQGAVLFAQSQIIASTVRIPDDIQPTMTSLRDALVLFKPLTSTRLMAGKGIVLKAFKADGGLLGTLSMEHPNDLPKTPRFLNNVDVAALDFGFTDANATVISANVNLAKLNDVNAVYLKSLLQGNTAIKIALSTGNWTEHVYLPAGNYAGKKIKVTSAAGYLSTLHYIGTDSVESTMDITQGSSEVLVAVAGNRWVRQSDLDHSRYVYGKNFWTARLPKEWVLPGLKLEFAQGLKKGSLNFAAQGMAGTKMGAPTELLLHTIDLGMLTAPRGEFYFAGDSTLHADYFQTIPVSRLVVNRYESLQLNKVVLPTGAVLTPANPDPSDGGWLIGDMRGAIGKLLVSHGIDNANYGISSSSAVSEDWAVGGHPFWVGQLAAHNSIGTYRNGVFIHGGSGGAGIVTLQNSIGNEFSHEVGHNYGLSHGSGDRGVLGAIHRPSTDVNSTWAWDSVRNIFIPNMVQKPTFQNLATGQTFERICNYNLPSLDGVLASQCVAPFQINPTTAFSFGRDAMSNGGPHDAPYWSHFNRYTIYTPHSASLIQKFLESKAVFDSTSSTGFRKWNAVTNKMEEIEFRAPYYLSANADVTTSNIANVQSYTAYLQRLFTQGADIVVVRMSNGSWGGTAVAPSAAANAGKWLTINHGASSATTWTINGQGVNFVTDASQTYKSNGSQWLAAAAYDGTLPRKPELFGVPVTTILGYYDPLNAAPTLAQAGWPGYVYPALHGAYGFVYPNESNTHRSDGCWLEVTTTQPVAVRRYKLKADRFATGTMNKFQVNVPESEGARHAAVYCADIKLVEGDLLPARDSAALTYTVNGMPLGPR